METPADYDDYLKRVRHIVYDFAKDLPEGTGVQVSCGTHEGAVSLLLRDIQLMAPLIRFVGLTPTGDPIQIVFPMPIAEPLVLTAVAASEVHRMKTPWTHWKY